MIAEIKHEFKEQNIEGVGLAIVCDIDIEFENEGKIPLSVVVAVKEDVGSKKYSEIYESIEAWDEETENNFIFDLIYELFIDESQL